MKNENEFLTATDISKIVSISRQAVNEWLNDGRLEYFKIGNTKRIRPEDFIEYLENLGNDRLAMANFKRNIAKYLYQKYKNEEYLNEAKTQEDLIKRYAEIKNAEVKIK